MKRQLIKQSFYAFSAICVGIIVHGCAVGPDYHQPSPPPVKRYTYNKLPNKTVSITAPGNAGKRQTLSYRQSIPHQWWRLFHSTSLDLLIQQGIEHNPTYKAAQKALEAAKYTLYAQIGNLLLPAADLQVGAERTRLATIQFGSATPAPLLSIYNVQGLASYTLDLFGGNRREVEFYQAKRDFEKYEMWDAYLSLTTNITTTVVNVASLSAQIQATKELIATEKKVLSIQKARLGYGGISREDVYLQETVLAQTLATLPPLEKSLTQENSTLAVLTGKVTTNTPALHLSLDSLNLPSNLPVSVPSVLVEQRPDILAASAMLHEMSAKVGVATANLLPKITISAGYGWVAPTPSTLFIPLTETWNILGNLLQPIFHGGALINERRAAVATYQQYYNKYQEVVLKAFKNVADALNAIQLDAKKFKSDMLAEAAAKRTLDTAFARYQLGGENYLNVMTAQQKYLQNKLNRIKSQAARFDDSAALFQALGGGWWDIPVLPVPKRVAWRRT